MIKPKEIIEQQSVLNSKSNSENYRLKLDENESVFQFPYSAYSAMKNISLQELSSPNFKEDYEEKISSIYGIFPKNIFFINDVFYSLYLIISCYLNADETLLCASSFFDYPVFYSRLLGANAKKAEFKDKIFNLEELQENIDDSTKIVFFYNPDEQTARLTEKGILEELLQINPEKLFVVDCSYITYSENDFEDFIELIKKYKNIIFIKTYNCDYNFNGFNAGIIVSCEEIITNLKKININTLDTIFLKALYGALKDKSYIEMVKNEITSVRDFLTNAINSIGYKVFPSQTNFILCDFSSHCEFYYNKFKNNSILVKKYPKNSDFADCLRITLPKMSGGKYIMEMLKKRQVLIFEIEGVIFDLENEELFIPREYIKEISKHYDLVIVTSMNEKEAGFLLRKYSIDKYFSLILFEKNQINYSALLDSIPHVCAVEFFTSRVERILETKKEKLEPVAFELKGDVNKLNSFKHYGAQNIISNTEELENYFAYYMDN